MKLIFGVLATLLVFSATAQASRSQQMITDLDFIKGIFATSYAPKEWKTRHLGWDLDAEIALAKNKILAKDGISNREYQGILHDFFRSTKDYHVSVSFYSTERSSLPFTVKGAEGKYFVVYIDRKKLSKESFPFNEGDEVISLDGKPVAQIVEGLRVTSDNGVVSTDQALAELYFTSRRATSFIGEVPRGAAVLEFKRKGSEKLVRHQLIWNYVAEAIPEWNGIETKSSVLAEKTKGKTIGSALLKEMISPVAKQLMASGEEAVNPYGLGNRTSYLPAFGEKIWESDSKTSLFHAYIYRSQENKLIGYIRLPNYGCTVIDEGRMEAKDTAECTTEFAAVMAKFEKTVDGLVIDQLNNPGGSVFYLYALASTLTDQPLFAPKHRMAINQSDVAGAIEGLPALEKVTNDEEAKKLIGETIGGYPVNFQVVQHTIQYYRFIIEEFKAGRQLTTPYYIWGADQINPHPTSRFTKPVLLLVNSLDFSGGDFFPAILQDNKRVTIMGTRTAGAGGYVGGLSYPNQFGVADFRFTGSIAERIDQNPIENLGVTPDVSYDITANDLQNGYADYLKAIKAQIASMVK